MIWLIPQRMAVTKREYGLIEKWRAMYEEVTVLQTAQFLMFIRKGWPGV